MNYLSQIIDEIVSIDLDDHFRFRDIKIDPLEHFHMEYSGARHKMNAYFGKTRLPLLIDLGCGDVAKVEEKEITLLANAKGPLFEEHISLACYPIFAEKLETLIFRGSQNSHMKDYRDLTLCLEKTLQFCTHRS